MNRTTLTALCLLTGMISASCDPNRDSVAETVRAALRAVDVDQAKALIESTSLELSVPIAASVTLYGDTLPSAVVVQGGQQSLLVNDLIDWTQALSLTEDLRDISAVAQNARILQLLLLGAAWGPNSPLKSSERFALSNLGYEVGKVSCLASAGESATEARVKNACELGAGLASLNVGYHSLQETITHSIDLMAAFTAAENSYWNVAGNDGSSDPGHQPSPATYELGQILHAESDSFHSDHGEARDDFDLSYGNGLMIADVGSDQIPGVQDIPGKLGDPNLSPSQVSDLTLRLQTSTARIDEVQTSICPPPADFLDCLGDSIERVLEKISFSKETQLMQTTTSYIAAVRADPGTSDDYFKSMDTLQERQLSFNQQYLQLQSQMQHENRSYTAISNIMKTKHDKVKNSISNVR